MDLTATPPGPRIAATARAPGHGEARPPGRHVPLGPRPDHRVPDGGQALLATLAARGARLRGYHRPRTPQETQPHAARRRVARRPHRQPDAASPTSTDGRLVIDDEARFRSQAAADLAWTAAFTTDDPTAEAARWIVWEASQALGARSASIHDLYMARGRGEVSGFTVPAINIRAADVRHGAHVLRDGARGPTSGAVIFELARSEQTYTFQRPMDYATFDPRGRDRGRLAAPGVHPGRPLPVQREEVRGRPRGDDRGDPAGVPARDRRRLPQHRHRQLHARRPLEARPRRGAARELRPRGGAHRAHPRASRPTASRSASAARSARSASRTRRPTSCEAYLDGYDRELATRAPGAIGPVQGQRPDRHAATAACRCPAAASPRSSSTSRSCASWARSRALVRPGRARSSTARRRCPTSCSTTSRRSRRPRSTSRRASRTRSTSTPRSRPRCMDEIYAWCEANAADERKDGQTEEQFLYTTRKKAIGPFKRQLWDLETKDEILAAQARQARVPVHRAAGERVDGAGRALRAAGRRSRGRSPSRSPSRSRAEPRRDDGRRRRRRPRRTATRRPLGGLDPASRRRATRRASARSSWPPSAGPRRPRSSTGSAPMRRTAGDRWSPSDADGRIVGHLLMSPCPVEDDDGGTVRDGARDRAGRGRTRRSSARGVGSALMAAAMSLAVARAVPALVLLGHPTYYPRFGFESGARRGPRAARRRPGRTPPGWPACCPPGPTTMRGHRPLPRGVRAARLRPPRSLDAPCASRAGIRREAVDLPRLDAYCPRQARSAGGTRAMPCARVPGGTAAPRRCGEGWRRSVRGGFRIRGPGGERRCPPAIAGHQAGAEAIPRLRRELRPGVQLHLGVDRHVHEPGGRVRRRWSGDLLGVAARHPRPDVRRPELRRAVQPLPGRGLDLPVVEAALEPDARLVHRLDLLLGRRHHRDRGRGDRAARHVDDLARPDQARRSVADRRRSTCSRSSASLVLVTTTIINVGRRPPAHDRSTTSASAPRSSGCSCSP